MRSYSLHFFLHLHSIVEPFTSHSNLHNYAEPKPFSWVKPAYVGISSSIFTMQDHILSIVGYVLRVHTLCQSFYKTFKYLYKRKKLHIVQAHKKIPSCPWLFWNVWQWIWQNLQWCKMGWDRNKRDWCIYETGQHTYRCNWCKSEGRAWSWKQCFNLVSCS